MLEHTKTPPTELLQVACPHDAYRDVCKFLALKGCTVERTVPIEDVLDMRPGVILRGARLKEEITQAELAEKTGIHRRHISDMENNRRPIGKANAKKLGQAFGVAYTLFL